MTKEELEIALEESDVRVVAQYTLLTLLLRWYDQRMSHDYFDPAGIDDVWETVRKYLQE